MFAKLMKYLPLLIILYAANDIYTRWSEHQEILENKRNSIPILEGQIVRYKKEKEAVESYMKDIEAAKQRIELVAQEVEALQRKLPANISDPENLGMFQDFANSLNIRNVSITPGREENLGFYFKKNYEFKGQGTFLQFLILMEKISENERLLNIKTVKMYKDTETQVRGRFQLIKSEMMIEAYRYNPDHKEQRTIETPPAKNAPGGRKA